MYYKYECNIFTWGAENYTGWWYKCRSYVHVIVTYYTKLIIQVTDKCKRYVHHMNMGQIIQAGTQESCMTYIQPWNKLSTNKFKRCAHNVITSNMRYNKHNRSNFNMNVHTE